MAPKRPSDSLSRTAVEAFCKRRWDLVREAKEQFWADDARARGGAAGLAAGEALWIHAREIDPSWPSEDERRADLEHHIALVEKLRRVAHAFADR